MKNQNDLIALIVAAVVAIAGVTTFFLRQPKPTTPAAPQPVVVTRAKLAEAAVTYANSLPGGSSNAGGGAGGGRGDGFAGEGGPEFGGR